MKDDFVQALAIAIQDIDGFVEGVSGMDDDGQIKFAGDVEVLDEESLLVGMGGEIVMKIQACFTNGDDLFVLGDLFKSGD